VNEFAWSDALRDLARHCHLSPADVLDGHTFGEFYALWCDGGETRKPHNPAAVFDRIDRLRAAKRLPPIDRGATKGK
jgi:hypothetical protein